MWIIGCDFHPGFQQIAYVDTTTGECGNMGLGHSNGEAERFPANSLQQVIAIARISTIAESGSATVFVFVFTLGDDGLMEFVADGIGKGINVVIAVDFDGLAGCVANYKAVVAPLQMLFQLRFKLDVNASVQVLV